MNTITKKLDGVQPIAITFTQVGRSCSIKQCLLLLASIIVIILIIIAATTIIIKMLFLVNVEKQREIER